MGRRVINGAYRTETAARLAGRREDKGRYLGVVTYHSEHGYGFALVGSAAHVELRQGFVGDGFGDRWPAKIVGVYYAG